MAQHELWELQQMQALPLSLKIRLTQERIRQWVNEFGVDGVYVSFSGGKDSTVLLTIAREMYPDIPAVFVDTGLEYPEIRQFVKTWDNVEWVKPKMTFKQVIEKYGYPFISKEVAECVYGARKYLTSVLEQTEPLDRQTDRQTCRIGTDLKDYADSESLARLTLGVGQSAGTENSEDSVSIRVRKTYTDRQIWKAVKQAECHKRYQGGVRRFSDLMGIRALDNSIDARLWKGYRQFADTASDGDKQAAGEGSVDNGDYP